MEKLLIYCLSLFLLFSCKTEETFYKKEFSKERELELAELLLGGMGYRFYYQGDIGEQMLLEEAEKYNPEHAEVWREKGIPYLKRGIAWGYKPNYEKCVQYDSVGWQGYRGYCTLYFYKDYAWALQDFDELDVLTPNFTDYPQATSIDYMRGVCYLGLGQPKKALEYLEKHIETEGKEVGFDYIYSVAYVLKGIAQKQLGQYKEAQKTFEFAIEQHEQNADLEYQLALLHYEQDEPVSALKWVKKAKNSFMKGYSNNRPYVEEFYQVYLMDIVELEDKIDKTRKI